MSNQRIRPGYVRMLVGRKFVYRSLSEVAYVRSNDNYVTYHFIDGTRFLSSYTLSTVEPMLGSGFVRIHKAYMVNLDSVASVVARTRSVVLLSKEVLPISRSRKEVAQVISAHLSGPVLG